MTLKTQHKILHASPGRNVVPNTQTVEEETLLFKTTHQSLGDAMWRILKKMTVDYRKKTAARDDFPIAVYSGYVREVVTHKNVRCWEFNEEVEGFFELCDILASSEDHQEAE